MLVKDAQSLPFKGSLGRRGNSAETPLMRVEVLSSKVIVLLYYCSCNNRRVLFDRVSK